MGYQIIGATSRKNNLEFAADKIVSSRRVGGRGQTGSVQRTVGFCKPLGVCRGKREHEEQSEE